MTSEFKTQRNCLNVVYHASQLTDVSDAAADYSFGYDDVGRITSITADLSGLTHSIIMAQTFDAASNRTQLAATIGSTADFVDDFTFDNLNRMTRIERQGVYGGNTVAEVRIDLVLCQSEILGLRWGGDYGMTSGNFTRTKEGSRWRRSISSG